MLSVAIWYYVGMPEKNPPRPIAQNLKETLEIYQRDGVEAAVEASGLSARSIYRWAERAGVRHERAVFKTGCPSQSAYNRGCCCDGCRMANRDANRESKRRRVERAVLSQAEVPHGVGGYSNWDCRCGTCRLAWSNYLRMRRDSAPNRKETS